MAGRSRAWCFTINNYTDADCEACNSIECQFIIVGKEVGDQGTPHLQGYVYFANAKALKNVVKLLGGRGHVMGARGSAASNIVYCSKDGDVLCERGDPPAQGKRNDLADGRQILRTTGSITEAINTADNPNFQFVRTLEVLSKYLEPQRDWRPTVRWYWGPSGTGKTFRAKTEAVDPWWSQGTLRWWDGYDAHKHVILDDFRVTWPGAAVDQLLLIFDENPFRVEFKGGSRQLVATDIWITSDKPPEQLWGGNDLIAVTRRIAAIVYIGTEDTEVQGNSEPGLNHLDEGPSGILSSVS